MTNRSSKILRSGLYIYILPSFLHQENVEELLLCGENNMIELVANQKFLIHESRINLKFDSNLDSNHL